MSGLETRLGRLAAANINLLPLPEISTHFVFERDGFVSMVERRDDSFGAIGAAGLLTERGFAALVWRGDNAFFQAKDLELPATPEQVERLRSFAGDLKAALE